MKQIKVMMLFLAVPLFMSFSTDNELRSDATFEEAIDFVNRYTAKNYYSSELEKTIFDFKIVIVDRKTFTIKISYKEEREGEGEEKCRIKKMFKTVSLKNLDPNSLHIRMNYYGTTHTLGISCTDRTDCFSYKDVFYPSCDIEDLEIYYADSIVAFHKDEATLKRIEKAFLHAVKLAGGGEEKF